MTAELLRCVRAFDTNTQGVPRCRRDHCGSAAALADQLSLGFRTTLRRNRQRIKCAGPQGFTLSLGGTDSMAFNHIFRPAMSDRLPTSRLYTRAAFPASLFHGHWDAYCGGYVCDFCVRSPLRRDGDGMQLCFPIKMDLRVTREPMAHEFDSTTHVRIPGAAGDGRRLQSVHVIVRFFIHSCYAYVPSDPVPAIWPARLRMQDIRDPTTTPAIEAPPAHVKRPAPDDDDAIVQAPRCAAQRAEGKRQTTRFDINLLFTANKERVHTLDNT